MIEATGRVIFRCGWLDDDMDPERDKPRIEWAWEGGDIIEIDETGLELFHGLKIDGDTATLGPHRARRIGPSSTPFVYLWVRDRGLRARLVPLRYRWSVWWDRLYYRLIRTANIWGLATCRPNVVPTWRDLHVMKRWAVRG